MTREVFRWIALTATVSTLIPLIFLLVYRKRQPRHHMILGVSLCLSLIFDVIGSTLAYSQTPNIFPHNLYRIIAFPAIMWFYHETLVKKSFQIIIRFFTIGFLVTALIGALNQGLHVMNLTTWTLSSVLITITSLFFVGDLNLMDEYNFTKNRFHETNIVLNTSLAIYYFATCFIFAWSDYIFSHFNAGDIRIFWSFHNAVHVLSNIGVAIAFYRAATSYHAM